MPRKELPGGQLLADQVDIAFRSGGLTEETVGRSLEGIQPFRIGDLVNEKKFSLCIIFLTGYFSNKLDDSSSIYCQAEEMKVAFNRWKESGSGWKWPLGRKNDKVKKSITMWHMLGCAGNVSESYMEELKKPYVPGSSYYNNLEAFANEWSKIYQITEAALDV